MDPVIFVELENGSLLNLNMIDVVVPRPHMKDASAFSGSILRAGDSHALYQHLFVDNPTVIVRPTKHPRNADGSFKTKEQLEARE